MNRSTQIICEWTSFFLFILLFVFLREKLSNYPIGLRGLPAYIGGAIGTIGIPLIFTIVLLLIRLFSNKTQAYTFFAKALWISTLIMLYMSILGGCLMHRGDYITLLFGIPFALGALFWIDKHKNKTSMLEKE